MAIGDPFLNDELMRQAAQQQMGLGGLFGFGQNPFGLFQPPCPPNFLGRPTLEEQLAQLGRVREPPTSDEIRARAERRYRESRREEIDKKVNELKEKFGWEFKLGSIDIDKGTIEYTLLIPAFNWSTGEVPRWFELLVFAGMIGGLISWLSLV